MPSINMSSSLTLNNKDKEEKESMTLKDLKKFENNKNN